MQGIIIFMGKGEPEGSMLEMARFGISQLSRVGQLINPTQPISSFQFPASTPLPCFPHQKTCKGLQVSTLPVSSQTSQNQFSLPGHKGCVSHTLHTILCCALNPADLTKNTFWLQIKWPTLHIQYIDNSG